jgi:hypothetical protein
MGFKTLTTGLLCIIIIIIIIIVEEMNLKKVNKSLITPWSRFPLVKLIVGKLSNKFPVFYKT